MSQRVKLKIERTSYTQAEFKSSKRLHAVYMHNIVHNFGLFWVLECSAVAWSPYEGIRSSVCWQADSTTASYDDDCLASDVSAAVWWSQFIGGGCYHERTRRRLFVITNCIAVLRRSASTHCCLQSIVVVISTASHGVLGGNRIASVVLPHQLDQPHPIIQSTCSLWPGIKTLQLATNVGPILASVSRTCRLMSCFNHAPKWERDNLPQSIVSAKPNLQVTNYINFLIFADSLDNCYRPIQGGRKK